MDDEKWNNTHSSSSSSSQYPITSTKPCSMSRSVSSRSPLQKNPFGLSRSSSQSATKNKSNLSRSSSHKCSEFTRKCSSMAKEQKAKFYIVKRCISMLVGWKKNRSDSWSIHFIHSACVRIYNHNYIYIYRGVDYILLLGMFEVLHMLKQFLHIVIQILVI